MTDNRSGSNSNNGVPAKTRLTTKQTDKESIRSRLWKGWILFLGFCVILASAYLIYSLYEIQIVNYEQFSKEASQKHWQRIKDEPERGEILDINGNVLAGTSYGYTVGITPSDFISLKKDVDEATICSTVAATLGVDPLVLEDAMQQTEDPYVQLAKNVSKTQIDVLRAFLREHNIGGTAIDSVAKRYYTNGPLASQIIGYATATDGLLAGQLGIEAQYNSVLTGKEGYSYVEVDNYTQGALPFSAPTTISAQDGYNVVLNIDLTIQQIVETACEDVYDMYDVIEGVTAIVMDPYTGRVHAIASYPDFDPNAPTAEPDWVDKQIWDSMTEDDQIKLLISKAWRNRAISDTYEPGSTFKALTTAIALEEGLTYEDEYFSDEPIVSGDYTISCWSKKTIGNHGTETLRDAFNNSCNPIFVQLAQRIGIDKYYQYVHNFGFYKPTGIDLPVEGVGIFHKEPTLIDMQTLSFGESSTVTPLQLANAYCAIVNGGTLMTPQIANRLTDNNGSVVKEFEPVAIRTILSEDTSSRIKAMMETVVTEGTGREGYVEGFSVAGKTSTSTIENGEYAGLHVLSFGSYAPSNDPKIVVLVVVNMPADKEVGSSCATRTAADIISKTLDYMGVERQYSETDYTYLSTLYAVPAVDGLTYKEAKMKLYQEYGKFNACKGSEDMTDDTIVSMSFPAAGENLHQGSTVVLYPSPDSVRSEVVLPDFTGKNITECIREAQKCGVNIVYEGDLTGVVVSQNPSFVPITPTPFPSITPGISPTAFPSNAPTSESSTTETSETTASSSSEISGDPSTENETGETESETEEQLTLTRVEKGAIIHLVMA